MRLDFAQIRWTGEFQDVVQYQLAGKLSLSTLTSSHIQFSAFRQFLLFADATNGKIMKASPRDSGLLTSVPLSSSIITRPVALGYDVVEDRVYWTDVTRNTISRSFLNGSMQEVIINRNLQSPDGLAVDIAGRNLYWTDTGYNKLEVSKLDGSYRKALITSGLDEPRDIILDVSKGSVLNSSIRNWFSFIHLVRDSLVNCLIKLLLMPLSILQSKLYIK